MTDTLPARRIAPELDRFARLGQWLALSESGSESPEARGAAAALRLYYAAELGLSPLAAAELSVIKGKLVVQAIVLRALAHGAGYTIDRPESTAESCTAVLLMDGAELGRATFTIEDAKRANLIRDKSAWTTHPARMLWARASSNVIKDFAPQVALGMITAEEAEEIHGVLVDEYDPAQPSAEGGGVEGDRAASPPLSPEVQTSGENGDAGQEVGLAPSAEDDIPFDTRADLSGVVDPAEPPPFIDHDWPGEGGSAAPPEPGEDDGKFPPADVPEGIREAQAKKLNVLVGNLRDHGFITTEQLWASVGRDPEPSEDGALHWAPLRNQLTKDEASALIDRLERYENEVAPGGFYKPKGT